MEHPSATPVPYSIGAPLARLAGRVAYEDLLARYQDMAIAPGEPVEFQNPALIVSVRRLVLEVA